MSWKTRAHVYLVIVHVVFAGALVVMLQDHPAWILLVEAAVVVSYVAGARLIRRVFEPFDLIRAGADLLHSGDFASRFHEDGHPELDALIGVYNRMAAELREERIKAEEQEYFLQEVLGASRTGVITLDVSGRVASANPAVLALFGCEAEALIGRAIGEAENPIPAGFADLPPGETRVLPFRGRRRLRCFRGALVDRGFSRDFFLLEELTKELRHSERTAYRRIVRTMSHEVNNTVTSVTSLLTSCRSYVDQLVTEDRADFRKALDVSVDRTRRLNAFVGSFAEVIRLPAPNREPVDLGSLVEAIQLLLSEESQSRLIRWRTDIQSPVPSALADRAQLEQVLLNIARNAVEAIGSSGVIFVTVDTRDGRPHLSVRDTGPGISREVRAHLFEPFWSSKPQGQGIGLTLVREILDAHGFEFTLEDDPAGGARFEISFA